MRRETFTSAAGMPSGGRHCSSTSCSSRTSLPRGSCSKFFLRSRGGDTWTVTDMPFTLVMLSATEALWRAMQCFYHRIAFFTPFPHKHATCQSRHDTYFHRGGILQPIHLHICVSWHTQQVESLLPPVYFTKTLIARDTYMQCEHRPGCSWWCRPSSRPHTGTSSPPSRTAPPPESWTRRCLLPSLPDLHRQGGGKETGEANISQCM